VTFVALPLIFRATPAHGELSLYFFSGVLRSIIPNFCPEYTGEFARQFSGNWRRILSIFILECLTENYLDVLSRQLTLNFLDFIRLIRGGFSRHFVSRLTFNFIGNLSGGFPWIFSIFCQPFHGKLYRYVIGRLNTLRTGLLNCLNARSRGLTFRHRASCI